MRQAKVRVGRDGRRRVFIGAYVPEELKGALERRAAGEQRTVSQEVTRILEAAVKGKQEEVRQ